VALGGVYLSGRGSPTLWTWLVGSLAILSGASLLIGMLTPVVGFLVGSGSFAVAFSWYSATAQNLLDNRLSIVFMVIMAAAIVLLGPGAYSLDARLFGRREIIIPQASRPPES
jgi:uncharacterized membrane protein YphA (DoxX/SURF4 family)